MKETILKYAADGMTITKKPGGYTVFTTRTQHFDIYSLDELTDETFEAAIAKVKEREDSEAQFRESATANPVIAPYLKPESELDPFQLQLREDLRKRFMGKVTIEIGRGDRLMYDGKVAKGLLATRIRGDYETGLRYLTEEISRQILLEGKQTS